MLGLESQTLLVVAPHPDDEVLGCGGLIKRVKAGGGKVYILFLTVGTTKDNSATGLSTQDARTREIEDVAKFLNYDGYKVAFPGDTYHLQLDRLSQLELINEVENGSEVSINAVKPSIIATPHAMDYHQDHRACAEAVIAATRPMPKEFKHSVNAVLGYEYCATAHWSISAPFTPNLFVGLQESDLEAKIQAMDMYASQARTNYHPRSSNIIKSLAYVRGAQSATPAAEAFYNYRLTA